MAAVASPPEEKAETMAEKILLQLKEVKITVTPEAVIIELLRSPGELTHKEWRIVKTFVDTIISEMRARPR
jgi:hypothetical protein